MNNTEQPSIKQTLKKAGESLLKKGQNTAPTPKWLRDPLLNQAAKERLIANSNKLDRIAEQEINRMKNDIRPPTHIEWQGKMVTPLEYWRLYSAERKRFDQAESFAFKRGEPYN